MAGGLIITADMVAQGLVAASARFGVDPLLAFDRSRLGGGKVRACVGAALVDMLERAGGGRGTTRRVAVMLELAPTQLASSQLNRSKIDFLDVAAARSAMEGQGRAKAADMGLAQAKVRTGTAMAARKAALQAAAFDPKALKGGKTAKAAPKFQDDPAPVRRDELSAANNATVASEAARQAVDDGRLVEACRRAGGFPIFHPTGPLRGKVTAPDAQTWGHG